MFAGVPASAPAPLCFAPGGRPPPRAVRSRQRPLPLCRERSVFLGRGCHTSFTVDLISALVHAPHLSCAVAARFQSESDLAIVHPVKTTADGGFISHSVSHRFKSGRFRRDLQSAGLEEQVYYKVTYKGRSLTFNLTVNHHLVSSNYVLERRNGGANRTEHPSSQGNSCHLVGTVAAPAGRGSAAVSSCGGLVRGLELCGHNGAGTPLVPFSRRLVP